MERIGARCCVPRPQADRRDGTSRAVIAAPVSGGSIAQRRLGLGAINIRTQPKGLLQRGRGVWGSRSIAPHERWAHISEATTNLPRASKAREGGLMRHFRNGLSLVFGLTLSASPSMGCQSLEEAAQPAMQCIGEFNYINRGPGRPPSSGPTRMLV